MTVTARKWMDSRDNRQPWRVTVRRTTDEGSQFVDVHRFRDESDADALLDTMPVPA